MSKLIQLCDEFELNGPYYDDLPSTEMANAILLAKACRLMYERLDELRLGCNRYAVNKKLDGRDTALTLQRGMTYIMNEVDKLMESSSDGTERE